jgi:hypothetical protein
LLSPLLLSDVPSGLPDVHRDCSLRLQRFKLIKKVRAIAFSLSLTLASFCCPVWSSQCASGLLTSLAASRPAGNEKCRYYPASVVPSGLPDVHRDCSLRSQLLDQPGKKNAGITRHLLSRLVSNQNSSEPKSDVLPITPRDRLEFQCKFRKKLLYTIKEKTLSGK